MILFSNIDDILQAIKNKRMLYRIKKEDDATAVVRVYSSDIQPASIEIRIPFTKPAAEYEAFEVAQMVQTALINGRIRPVKECCSYIAKIYWVKSQHEEIKGILPTIESAKELVEFIDTSFSGIYIAYIDAPDGVYIYGEESRHGSKKRWYVPEELEETLIYDVNKAKPVRLDELLPYPKWREFVMINKMKQNKKNTHTKRKKVLQKGADK